MSAQNKVRMLTTHRSSGIKLPLIRQQQLETCSRTANYTQDVTDFLDREEMQIILRNMPASFRKQFRPELRRKKPLLKKGCHHHDFHGARPTGEAILHGVILLGRDHHDMMGEEPPEPGTPPPLSGRKHCLIQTDIYLENILNEDSELWSKEVQCNPIEDEPLEPPKLTFDKEGETTTGTQLDQWTFADMDGILEQISTNLGDAVIMESLRQLQEEHELHSLIVQRDRHQCLVDYELALLERYKKALALWQEQEKYLKNRKPWEETLDEIIALVGFDKIRDIAPDYFISDQMLKAIMDHIDETMVPPVNKAATLRVQLTNESRKLLDDIIDETVTKREAEYAGKIFVRDARFKVSLASEQIDGTYLEDEDVTSQVRKSGAEEDGDQKLLLAYHSDSTVDANWDSELENFKQRQSKFDPHAQRKSVGASSGNEGGSEHYTDFENRGSFEYDE